MMVHGLTPKALTETQVHAVMSKFDVGCWDG